MLVLFENFGKKVVGYKRNDGMNDCEHAEERTAPQDKDLPLKEAILVFPNPSSDKIQVVWKDASDKAGVLKIMNAFGKVVQEVQIAQESVQVLLDVSSFDSGIFFIELNFENREPIVTQFTIID